MVESSFSVGYRVSVQGSLREALHGDGLVLCLALMNARTPDVPAIAAACGYDAVYVDLEHTSTSLETAAMLCASAAGAEFTWGTMTPAAPLSRTRAMRLGSCDGTRTSPEIPAPAALAQSIAAVSSEVDVCSRST
ncbi:hypothetical protein A5662_14355 [Mycobacteriaceae bacterium 1482268.1]|nr:hypothetical protein A5662_14355 [Mycobacteriaceae bacterium 1482268.1]